MLTLERVEVENWGPIAKANIELGNITVLIGPQNSGKTILALLVYILAKDVANTILSSLDHGVIELIREKGITGLLSSEYIAELVRQEKEYVFEHTRNRLVKILEHSIINYVKRNYGVDNIDKIIRSGSEKAEIHAEYLCGDLSISLSLSITREGNVSVNVELSPDIIIKFVEDCKPECAVFEERAISCVWKSPIMFTRPLYIPAERFVIIPNFYYYLSFIIDIHRIVQVRSTSTLTSELNLILRPALLDYLECISRTLQVAEGLQEGVLEEGKFEVVKGQIWYIDKRGVKVPLTIVSSGIAQLIGIILPLTPWLRELRYLQSSRLLIIEEPEVNLHPDLHLKVSEYLARLSRKYNIKMLITTHSHYLLAKLAHLYAKSEIEKLKVYYIDTETQCIEELPVSKETGEVPLPRSIEKALDAIAREAMELVEKTLLKE